MGRTVSVCAIVFFGSVAAAAAQTVTTAEPKWEIEVHLGGAFGSQPTGGTPIAAFPVGDTFTTAGRPSRYASTWYFGDGAELLNQAAAGFRGTPFSARITPLDPVLTRAALHRKNGFSVGARVNRRLTSRLAAEFSVDSVARSVDLTDGAVQGVEATRASFAPTWDGIIATGGGLLFTNGRTTSTSTFVNGTSARETSLTGAINVALTERTRLTPYLTAGAGVRMRSGGLPTARLLGSYRFDFLDVARFQESDAVLVHFVEKDTAPVGVFGGGVKYALSPRQGVRADVRVHVGPSSVDTLVDTLPSAALGTSSFSISSATTPPLVFSNTAAVRSNLTGPATTDLKTFTGSGQDIQTRLTVGYFLRFSASPVPRTARTPRTPAPALAGAKWEIEGHAGGAFGSLPDAGTAIGVFPVGESFTTIVGTFSSRRASTWYFGDGARLLNQIASGFTGTSAATTRITPLDPVLTTAALERKGGPGVGVRLTRRLTPIISAEFGLDSASGTLRISSAALDGLEATRASFAPVWNALIAAGAGIFASPIVSSNSALTRETDSRETLVTGAMTFALPGTGRLEPYVTGGAGARIRSGDLPSAALTGNYQFRFLGTAPLNETDVVTVHFAAKDTTFVGLFGGGVKYTLTPRQGLRAEVRVRLSPNAIDTLVTARPAAVLGTPPFFISSATTPSLVLSTSPMMPSNLTGPAIVDLKTFTGSGRDWQTNLSVGYFVRF